ncbi:MAG: hypothetical protein WC628_03725 [Candidatus Omnitrophota bacterium]
MSKNNISIVYRVSHWFTYHPWLKVISFVMAVIAWFYVKGEISRYN